MNRANFPARQISSANGRESGATSLSTQTSQAAGIDARPLISVILPIYNQADHLRSMVHEMADALTKANYHFELLLVSNACRDDSPAICRELSQKLLNVRAIDSVPGGWGLAVRLGLREAKGEWICYTNSARTTSKQLLLVFEDALNHSPAAVKAKRTTRGFSRGMGSRLYNLECRLLFGVRSADVNGTPKIFPRQFGELLELKRNDDLIDAEFCWVCKQNRYPLREILMPIPPRHGGESTTSMKSAVRMYRGAFDMWMHRGS